MGECNSSNSIINEVDTKHACYIPESASDILYNSIVKIEINEKKGTGFFMKAYVKGNKMDLFLTCNHVMTIKDIVENDAFSISYGKFNKEKKKIYLNNKRFMRTFESPIDITVIEIIKNDNIPEDKFLFPDLNYKYGYLSYKNKKFYLAGYPNSSERAISSGTIKKISDYEFTHSLDARNGSSGSPICLIENNRIIGIHKGGDKKKPINYGTFIGYILDEFEKEDLGEFAQQNLYELKKQYIKTIFKETTDEKIIYFIENNDEISIKIHKRKTVNDLISKYYKKKNIENNNQKSFLYRNNLLEEMQNKKIEQIFEQYKPPSNINDDNTVINYLISYNNDNSDFIKVIEKKKIIFKETIDFKQTGEIEIYIYHKKTITDLISAYCKNRNINDNTQYKFIYNHNNINTEENYNSTIENLFQNNPKDQNIEILVIKKEEIIIKFSENSIELTLSIEKTINDLIDIYSKEKGINNNQTIFLYENENILENKNIKIKELIKEGSQGHYLNIWAFEKEKIKINIYNGNPLFEQIISRSTKVSDLNIIFNKNQNNDINKENHFITKGQSLYSNIDKDKRIEDFISPDELF